MNGHPVADLTSSELKPLADSSATRMDLLVRIPPSLTPRDFLFSPNAVSPIKVRTCAGVSE